MTQGFTDGMRTSLTDEWATPAHVFNALDKEFNFKTDVCADATNHKCERYYTKEQDGLKHEWTGICWMNPPYGRAIGQWVRKAYESAKSGAIVVCLLPARIDTKWWSDYCMQASENRLIRGRLKFGNSANCAPFPSAIVIFGTPVTPKFSMISFEDVIE